MHQSGHSRAHSMQTVQFSSLSAMTPRERAGSGAISSGYWTVTAWETMWRMVTPRPFSSPVPKVLFFRLDSSAKSPPSDPVGELERAGDEDVRKRQRDEDLPCELLELVLPQAREGPAYPDQQEDDDARLQEEPHDAGHEPEHRDHRLVAAEEQRGGKGGHADHGDVLGGEEPEGELHRRVLGEGARDDLGLGDGHVEGSPRHLGRRRGEEDEEAQGLGPEREGQGMP